MGAAAAVAVLIRKEKEIVYAFQARGATDPARAVTLDSLNVHGGLALKRLEQRAVIRAVGDDRYYLDEPSWEAVRGMRRRMLPVIFGVILVCAVFAWLITQFAPHA